ncbi:hypothetical protein B4099_2409 [Heyndrickxia coagulans]|uniref:Uncharacterized protein n=1 Tax=Heyndrickxia coagulans TaxID=1398 RepID=A0A150KDE9_HEYCO|nr:hypothetical protein B4099_2409 [Heyndrickxia coagulans]
MSFLPQGKVFIIWMCKQQRKLACPGRKKTGRRALAGFFEKIFTG